MSDFRTKRLNITNECSLSDVVPLYDKHSETSYINQLSTVIDGGLTKSGFIKTGYHPYMTNLKCYPLELDEQGRAFVEIQRKDTSVSSVEYDEESSQLILKLNDPTIADLSIPVNDLINRYYVDDVTISSKNNVFGICDGVLHKNGNYLSAFSTLCAYQLTRRLDETDVERDPVSFLNCVRTDADYENCKSSSHETILDYRDANDPYIEYWYEEYEGEEIKTREFRRERLISYSQLQLSNLGTDIRVGEFIYNKISKKLWYMKSKEISDIIQLDEDYVNITVTNNQSEDLSTLGSGIYVTGDEVRIEAQLSSSDGRFNFLGWNDGNTTRVRTITAISTCTYTAIYSDANLTDYYDSNISTIGYGTDFKCLSAGRYFVIGVGSGGDGLTSYQQWTSNYWNDQYAGGYVRNVAYTLVVCTGGSGSFISGIFELGENTNCQFTTGKTNTNTVFKSIDDTLNVVAYGSNDSYGGASPSRTSQISSVEVSSGANGRSQVSEYWAYDRGGAILYDQNGPYSCPIGGRRTRMVPGSVPKDDVKYDGADYVKNGLNYGAGVSYDGSNNETKGYLHVERFMEVRFLDYNGRVIKGKQYITRNNKVAEIPESPQRPGYTFSGWSQNPSTYEITADYDFVAQYTPNNIYITVQSNDKNMGNALSTGVYTCDEETTLSAIANYGYKLLYWDDDHSLTSTRRDIIIPTADTTYTAIFDKDIVITYYDNLD